MTACLWLIFRVIQLRNQFIWEIGMNLICVRKSSHHFNGTYKKTISLYSWIYTHNFIRNICHGLKNNIFYIFFYCIINKFLDFAKILFFVGRFKKLLTKYFRCTKKEMKTG